MTKNANPLNPSATVLCKLGSIAVHVQEMLEPGGHPFDRIALNGLLNDSDVKEWLAQMDAMAMIPNKRR